MLETISIEHDYTPIARVLVTCEGWTWSLPWVSIPDEHGRVYRRNCCPDDTGFGWTQVNGPVLPIKRPTSGLLPDLRCPSALGCLLHILRKVSGDPRASVFYSYIIAGWKCDVRDKEPVESYVSDVDAVAQAFLREHGKVCFG